MDTDWLEKVPTRAYVLWEHFGRPEGTAEGHWLQAEEELRAEEVNMANPGDEAPAGKAGTGEDLCSVCHGNGRKDGATCANCGGEGKVIAGIGGA